MPRGTSKPRKLYIQDRDIDILSTLGEVSVLDTTTVHERWWSGKTEEACRARLRLFEQHSLIQCLTLDVVKTKTTGSIPKLHRLTPSGADLVHDHTGVRPRRTARSDPPKRTHTLLHRVGMAKTMLKFNDACRACDLSQPDWILEYDGIPGARLDAPHSERFVLRHDIPTAGGHVTVWPDAACRLAFPGDNGRVWKLAVLFEYDTGSERHLQLENKLPGYSAFFATKLWNRLWPDVDSARLFFVVQSNQRVKEIRPLLANSSIASFVRLAAVPEMSPAERVLTDPIWSTPAGELKAILQSGVHTATGAQTRRA